MCVYVYVPIVYVIKNETKAVQGAYKFRYQREMSTIIIIFIWDILFTHTNTRTHTKTQP